ncbi:lipase member J-like [Maniola jurtina]|uniref:lipase member J-like n=1 Tax=Maniola jurtina TaxID=191418 RepID=UPI001E688E02|nr:lipase member J-like [Maniola jurtina]
MQPTTLITSAILLIISIQQVVHVASEFLPEDSRLNTIELATKYKHPPLQFDVVTEDGYILALFRLPGRSKVPVLLVHGLGDSSDTWLLRGSTSLAITLANDGYDVWLANVRGNRYSRRHVHLNPDKDPAFWHYSFHEIGYYDLPAIIDTILNTTAAESLTYIGHSQGTTACYVLGSQRKEYNSKINVMISLAPVAYVHHTPPLISFLRELSPVIEQVFKVLSIHEVFADNTELGKAIHRLCPLPIIGYIVCVYGLLFPMTGSDFLELEPEFSQIGFTHSPAGTSSRSMFHYAQVGNRKKFAQYDYGGEGNVKHYNSTEPPVYRLDQVTMPVALLVGRNDNLSTVPDVELLKEQLANVVYYNVNPNWFCNHVDFIWGLHMSDYLYPQIYEVLDSYKHF